MKRTLCLIMLLWAVFAMAAAVASAQSREDALRLHHEAYALQEKAN